MQNRYRRSLMLVIVLLGAAVGIATQALAQFTQQGPKLVDPVSGPYQGSYVGAAWVFTRSNGVWTQQGNKLVGTGAAGPYANQGASVSLSADGNTAIIGGPGDGFTTFYGVGAAWVFTRTTSTCERN